MPASESSYTALMNPIDPSRPARVLLVEDDVLLGTLLQELLSSQPAVKLVGVATTAAEAWQLAERSRPDIVLLDIGLPDRSGLDLLPELTRELPDLRVVMLTLADDMDSVLAAFRSGAIGFIPKRSAMQCLSTAIEAVRKGHAWIDPAMTLAVLQELRSLSARMAALQKQAEPLSAREREVGELVARGCRDDEIARELHLSPHTIRVHIKRIRHKLNLPNRAALAAYIANERR